MRGQTPFDAMKSVFVLSAVLLVGSLLGAPEGEFKGGPIDGLLKEKPPAYTIDASGLQLNNHIAVGIELRANAFACTGDRRALDDAVRFFRAVDAYPDWRQQQFFQSTAHIMEGISRLLEVGKNALASEVRDEIECSLYEKGVVPARTAPFWKRNDDVTQICAPAVAYAVFVLKDRYPECYDELFEKAVAAFAKTYGNYTDEGNWAAGPGFAFFANERLEAFSQLMIRLTGGDRGLSKHRGYLASPRFLSVLIGLTGQFYNYADGICKPSAELRQRPVANGARLFNGPEPVAIVCTDDFYLGVKGGHADFPQQHMDAGSFIFESVKDGKAVRWIEDPSPERFRHLLRMKLALDDYSDSSSRWSVDNMSVRHHSVCYLDDRPFSTAAHVSLALEGDVVVADLSALFADACARATRRLKPAKGGFEMVDEFAEIRGEHCYTFNFTTFRSVSVKGGKVVFDDGAMTLSASVPGEWKIEDLSRPAKPLLKRRPGFRRVAFRCPLAERIAFSLR